ncbi:tannase/feruloyl esterase family alpha/beta hydrolase [Kiritimatiellota bacterium B12222]|nr:tannase/feruloyl esterase family alpha/beta hydrolase [Kiritimatiellota bacterium B12222]
MKQTPLLLGLWILAAGLSAETTSPLNMHAPPIDESRLASLRKSKIEFATITSVAYVTDSTKSTPNGRVEAHIPPRTIVKMVLNPTRGSNIKVEIWLPDNAQWNGRFLGLGNGGAAGSIHEGGLIKGVSSGYATATTDMGTAAGPHSGIDNQEVWKDFGFRATHLMTVTSKQLIESYYGKPPRFSYFSGGSTGGQQALQEAQRYPEDYDGILAMVPAHARTPLHAYFLWNHQILLNTPFTPSQEANIIAAANDYMADREIPGIAGHFISDPRATQKDIEGVIALAQAKDPSLTPAHAEALQKLFDGPRHAVTGERIFNGVPFGSTFSNAHGHLYLFYWVFGSKTNLMTLNFGDDFDTYTAALAPFLNAENADLRAFAKRGGKMIMVSGSADSIVPYHATLDYYERVTENFGDIDKVSSFLKFYLIPGMTHSGSYEFQQPKNLLEALIDWREQDLAPEALLSRKIEDKKVVIEMPIYPYPTKTIWDESTSSYQPVEGPRRGVDRIAEDFRPAAAE